jgi:branched-chain amino acid transport system substrate-binding protein
MTTGSRISSANMPNEGVTHMKNRRYGVAAALASSLVLLTAACSSSGSTSSSGSVGATSGSSKAPYNIGLAAGITGPAAAIVTGEIEGIKAAFSQVNASGGIDGRKLNLITSDTQNVATTAVAALTKLATENNVIASFGDILANNCQAQVPVAKAHQIPLICGTLDPEQLQPAEPYVYTEYGAEITETDGMTDIIENKPLNLAHPKVAIVYLQSSSNEPLFNAVAAKIKADGGQVVLTDPIQAELNLSVDASKVISSGANVVVEQIIPQQLQSLSQSLTNAGSKVPIVAEATTSSYQQMVLLKNPDIYEMSLDPFVDPTSTDPAVTDYVNALKLQGITGVSGINGQSIAITYASAEALIDALKMCGASCTNTEVNTDLQKVSLNLPGIDTDYSYTATRHYPQDTFDLYQWSSSTNAVVQLRDDVPSNPIPSS